MPFIVVKAKLAFTDTENLSATEFFEKASSAFQIDNAKRKNLRVESNPLGRVATMEFLVEYEKEESPNLIKSEVKKDIENMFQIEDCVRLYANIKMRRKTAYKIRRKKKKVGVA